MSQQITAQTEQEKETQNGDKGLLTVPTSHDMVAPDAILGLEGIEREDITLPRIKLLQAMSDEVSNSNASPGDWLNTLSGQSYGTQFEFIPISVWKSRTYFAEKRDDSPICRSADSFMSVDGYCCMTECPHDRAWDWKGGVPPLCTLGYNYLVIPLIDPFPAIVTLMKSSFKTGKALNTLLMATCCPAWFWVYEFYSVRQSNSKGTFYVAAVKKKIVDDKPVASNDGMRQIAEHFYRMAKSGRIEADSEEAPF